MARSPVYTTQPWQETYSEMIDVRSESEYAEDCLPGAINLPVLTNHQRSQVGIFYKQVSAFDARKLGAALVSQNISRHLTNHFAHQTQDYAPLVYCWRGGQRSQSLALVLTQIGWRVGVLEGGYKTYRTYVRQQLEMLPRQFHYRILCGLTGSGKTHLLKQWQQQGAQVLDLEGLANHRGSLLGQEWLDSPLAQPSQKKFESRLLQTLQTFDPTQVVWIESESNKIGQVHLPPSLWQQMKTSPGIEVRLPLSARVTWLLQEYAHLMMATDLLKAKLLMLKRRYGMTKIEQWFDWIDRQNWWRLVADLLQTHYDPAYRRSLQRTFHNIEQVIDLPDLSTQGTAMVLKTLQQTRQTKC